MCLGVPSEGTGFGFIPDLGLSRVRPGSWNPGFQDCRCRASRSVRTQRLQSGQMQLCLRELLYPSLKHTYTCNYMHWYIHACMCSSIHPSIHSFVHSFFCSCIYLCIHAFMQAGMPYRRTYTQKHASTSTSVSAHLDARVFAISQVSISLQARHTWLRGCRVKWPVTACAWATATRA